VPEAERLSKRAARARAERAARALARDPRTRLVYVFGSAAGGGDGDAGDVDLAIWSEPPLPAEALLRLRAELVLEVGGPLDLVSLHDAPIVLAHEVVENGRCIFARRADDETDFVVRTRSRWLDWKPYREEQWRLAGERLRERGVGP
jgi:predicted nucleotidyltransferase